MTTPNNINSNFRQIAVADAGGNVYGVNISNVGNLQVAGGSNNQFLKTNGSGVLSFAKPVTSTTNALVFGATTSPPQKATTRQQDYITIIDDGSGWCTVVMEYAAASAAGATNGSGIYLLSLFSGYTFDNSVHPTNTSTAADLSAAPAEWYKFIPCSGYIAGGGFNNFGQIVVCATSATQFKIITPTDSFKQVGSAHWALGFYANAVFTLSFRFKKL